MDAQFLTSQELIRPWRRATFVAGTIAAIELIALLGAGAMLLAKPITHAIDKAAVASIESTPPSKQLQTAIKQMNAPAGKPHPRHHVKIMVLNGNGVNGAAGTADGLIDDPVLIQLCITYAPRLSVPESSLSLTTR